MNKSEEKFCYVCGKETSFMYCEDLCMSCYDRLQLASKGKQRESLNLIAPALVAMLRNGVEMATKKVEELERELQKSIGERVCK